MLEPSVVEGCPLWRAHMNSNLSNLSGLNGRNSALLCSWTTPLRYTSTLDNRSICRVIWSIFLVDLSKYPNTSHVQNPDIWLVLSATSDLRYRYTSITMSLESLSKIRNVWFFVPNISRDFSLNPNLITGHHQSLSAYQLTSNSLNTSWWNSQKKITLLECKDLSPWDSIDVCTSVHEDDHIYSLIVERIPNFPML